MRNMVMLMMASVLAGCASAAPIALVPSPLTPEDAFSCVMRETARLGYTAKNADRAAGVLHAEKKSSGTATLLLSGDTYWSELDVAVLPSTDKRSSELRIQPSKTKELRSGQHTSAGMSVTKDVKADAEALRAACTR